MSYLLDTCIVSKARKLASHPDPKLRNWLSTHKEHDCFLSVLSIGEIQSGISKIDESNAELARYKMTLEDWLFGDLIPRFKNRILGIDEHVMLQWGQLNRESKKAQYTIPIVDGMIAATAMHYGLAIVTENSKDFMPTGTVVINPWDL